MKKMIVQRLLHLVVVLFLVTLVSFFLMYFSPGDPVTALLSRGGTVPDPDVVAQKRAELGLDRPVAEQYVAWLAGIFQGNLGISIGSAARCIGNRCAHASNVVLGRYLSCAHACGVHSSWLLVRSEEEPRN